MLFGHTGGGDAGANSATCGGPGPWERVHSQEAKEEVNCTSLHERKTSMRRDLHHFESLLNKHPGNDYRHTSTLTIYDHITNTWTLVTWRVF